jgi:hypothetical protein
VVLPVPAVSGRHARIEWDEAAGSYFLEDLGSLNGTELDGEPLSGRERLDRLHVITLGGKLDLIFQGPELCARRAGAGRETDPAAGAGTLLEERPVELPAALGARPDEAGGTPPPSGRDPDPGAAGSERTELDLEVLSLPGAIDPPDPDSPDSDAPDPEPPAGDGG